MSGSERRGFAQRHGLWDEERSEHARQLAARIEARELKTVRFSFADQHGLLRGKTLTADAAVASLRDGDAVSITTTLLAKDTSHKTVFPVFSAGGGFGMRAMQGGADALMLPDPASFRELPWAPGTGWLLCDLYFADGEPVPFSTRQLLRGLERRLDARGLEMVAGLEVEFHLFRLLDPRLALGDAGLPGAPGAPPEVALLTQGYQYLTELRYDQIEPALEALRADVVALGLPLRSLEVEYGPSQCEFTLQPGGALESADRMVLLRSAIKQSARRHGLHASFMCRPRIPNVMSSGWHLHQSLRERALGANAMTPAEAGRALSPLGASFLGGLLAHARAGAAFASPTVNGYRRFRANSLAPDRVLWARDNRAAMLRVLGGAGDPATRIENRVGEPAANPYLYIGSQIVAGLDGIERQRDPGAPADTPYEVDAPRLPHSLDEALDCLQRDPTMRAGFGDAFVDYYVHMKRCELARFHAEVSEWEHREYFDLF